jgi:hypothetical protein
MNTNELKQRLFEGIENIDDSGFLLTIKELIDHKYSESAVPVLTPTQLQRIDESENQITAGDYLLDSEVNQLMEKWLNE